jgi:protein TonB
MYEHSLLGMHRRSKARLVFVLVAIALHGVVLAGVAIGQYWTIDQLAEPAMVVSFVADLPQPPPPRGGPPPPPRSRAAQPTSSVDNATAPVQPVAIPDVIPAAPDALEIPSVGGVPDGVPNGAPDGVPNGVPGAARFGVPDGIDGAGGPPSATILHVRGDVVKPVVLARVEPVYTEIARRARIQGVVIVETIIDTHGRVTDARIFKSLPMGLSESAVDAVRQWRFEPATLDGRAVSVYFTLTVKFELQ